MGQRVGDMSGGSSCSQTPSRAIPTTRRVVLGDGVQLPPGDYSTTPGGTLFSTTPGGRRGLGGRVRTWGRPSGRDPKSRMGRGGWKERLKGIGGQRGSRRWPPPIACTLVSGCVVQSLISFSPCKRDRGVSPRAWTRTFPGLPYAKVAAPDGVWGSSEAG